MLAPAYVLPGASWPTAAQMNAWPVIYVSGNHTVNASATDGNGILVVTVSLTISGSWRHEGIVLVGGTLTSNGNNTITGAVVTGLNVKLGIAVPVTAVGNGTKTYQYDSCDIASALQSLGGFRRIPNGWMDNWPSW